MDKRKLIGTIIGVIMFAALIVGATYAWLSFTANVVNTTTTGTTLNYWVNYAKSTDLLSDMPILSNSTTTTASKVTVTAQRPQGSIADNITLYLTTTSTGTLTTSGAVKYVVCEGDCTSTTFSGYTIGSVTAASTVSIYTDTLPGETTSSSNDTVTYNIYFWIDVATLVNDHLGQTYEGYIHADSTQNTTN